MAYPCDLLLLQNAVSSCLVRTVGQLDRIEDPFLDIEVGNGTASGKALHAQWL